MGKGVDGIVGVEGVGGSTGVLCLGVGRVGGLKIAQLGWGRGEGIGREEHFLKINVKRNR